ncbi:zinc finger CCHC domain-containing protein 8 homolog [Colias croceus]|uniref:zinc finger CCHC domain-containing protein 8 homolog n=1 Tax=Colias crocea TaxID=72248 RepID=UPI001E27B004|nr:zinc finger CCHC domain-containing protein 8 homolog [Colias croceus]
MAKRKTRVNNIIYELDNEDLSTDDEGKECKILCTEQNKVSEGVKNSLNESDSVIEISDIDSSHDTDQKNINNEITNNGGKTEADGLKNDLENKNSTDASENKLNGSFKDGQNPEMCKTIIFNEDIDIDSPASVSNSDLGVVGCENRIPLVSVRFRDKTMAKVYKKKLKDLMLKMIKLNEMETFSDGNDTDVELDIWPEDLSEEEVEKSPVPASEDNLFFVDTDPQDMNIDIPMYEQASQLISNASDTEKSAPQVLRRGPTCFNCEGAHPLRECTLPRNNAKIAENRRNIGVKLGRYHVEDEQKYGHLIPGRISGQLRNALGLKRNEIPMHIYRMRMLGYPPGWLEDARISHSGITMFDSTGRAIQDPDEEEGEVCDPGCKDKFDIKKILDFPGFNVPASSRYKEEGHLYGFPPMSDQDSKMVMLQMLAPNAMKAYKRKKLTFFPSSNNNSIQEGQAEMELDSGDESTAFPSVPPLPDDEPPPLPPPPSSPPPESPKPITTIQIEDKDTESDKSQSDIEIVQVTDIPVPEDDLITIDDDDDDEVSILSSGRNSPTIDDLEAKKRQLLDAIKYSEIAMDSSTDTDVKEVDLSGDMSEVEFVDIIENQEASSKLTQNVSEETKQDETLKDEKKVVDVTGVEKKVVNESENNEKVVNETEDKEKVVNETEVEKQVSYVSEVEKKDPNYSEVQNKDINESKVEQEVVTEPIVEKKPVNETEVPKTPDMRTGIVKTTEYGTPVMNIVSPYMKLPSDDKFAKDICDVIQFENLPNSVGKYKKISSLLKKVKSEVDRIQDS